MGRDILKDRSGKISGAMAVLLAIVVILLYTRVASTPKGSEDTFYFVYGTLKWFLKALDLLKYVEEYLKSFEEFLKYVQGTELWPLIISILALVVMELAVMGAFYCALVTVGTTTRVLGFVSEVRDNRKKFHDPYGKSRFSVSKIVAAVGRLGKLHRSKSYAPNPSIREKVVKLKKLPPWRRLSTTEWWDLGENQLITLKEGVLRHLIMEAKKLCPTKLAPKGSITKLAERSGIDSAILCRAMNQEDYAMTVKNIKKLLDALHLSYGELTPYIKSIGGGGFRESITNPKLPFDLYNEDGATLVAAGLKDGHVRKDRTIFEYINYDEENVRRVIESVNRVFGDVTYQMRYDEKGRHKGVVFNSEAIGLALHRAGVPKGRKTEQDYHLPDVIKFGDIAIKKSYFKQYIRDDGHIDYRGYLISMINAHEIESSIKSDHRELFDYLPWKNRKEQFGYYVTLSKWVETRIPSELKPVYRDFIINMKKTWIPDIVKEEKAILERTFHVKAKIVPKQI
ncbi:MAG: hypothetical protein JTT11_03280 [Candidatus Brockarchaeota archaeon]|nr:hypothetical protein [Candidatus Brockarchaeota archaeon]